MGSRTLTRKEMVFGLSATATAAMGTAISLMLVGNLGSRGGRRLLVAMLSEAMPLVIILALAAVSLAAYKHRTSMPYVRVLGILSMFVAAALFLVSLISINGPVLSYDPIMLLGIIPSLIIGFGLFSWARPVSPLAEKFNSVQGDDPAYKYIPKTVKGSSQSKLPHTEGGVALDGPAYLDDPAYKYIDPSMRMQRKPPTETGSKLPKSRNFGSATESLASDKNVVSSSTAPVNLAALPNAKIAIQYRPEIDKAWTEAQDLPAHLQARFLKGLEKDPKMAAATCLDPLKAEHEKELRPYDDDILNAGLDEARRLGGNAEAEYRSIIDILGETASVVEVLTILREKYGLNPPVFHPDAKAGPNSVN